MEAFVSEFSFDQPPLRLDEGNDFIARVGSGIRTRAKLFEVLRHELRLPSYFGDNWDALSDCLRDLSWLNRRRVVLQHAELPKLDAQELAVYLDVLSESVRDWKPTDDHQLLVVFPETAQQSVSAILGQRLFEERDQ